MYEIIQNADGIPVGFIASDNGTFTEQQAKDSILCGKLNPSKTEIDKAIALEETTRIANKYRRDRASEYPSFANQLDMLYHDIKNGTLESGAWIQAIEQVKTTFPKE